MLFDASAPNSPSILINNLMAKGLELYGQYVEPKLTKENIYQAVAGSVGFSAYYGMAPAVDGVDPSAFIKRSGIAIGYKVFNNLATPMVAQFVQSFAEVNINNAKYTYYSIRCVLQTKFCNEASGMPDTVNIVQDFSQFDVASYAQSLKDSFGKLTLEGLLLNGMISATASDIQDTSFVATGFNEYCQSTLCKDYATYYYKEWVDNQIKTELSAKTEQNVDAFDFADYIEKNHPEIFPAIDHVVNTLNLENLSFEKLASIQGISLNFVQVCQNDHCEDKITFSMIDGEKNEIYLQEVIHGDGFMSQTNGLDTTQLGAIYLNQTCPVTFLPTVLEIP